MEQVKKVKRVFFSYAWADALAMKIYEDLVRSGANVWRDQIDGRKGKDIEEQIEQRIRESDCYLLLDSANSRRSASVRREYGIYGKHQARLQLEICLLHDRKTIEGDSFGNGYDTILAHDFSNMPYRHGEPFWDNDGRYLHAIKGLCNNMGFDFISYGNLPEGKDLDDELMQANVAEFNRRVILSDFSNFRNRSDRGFPGVSKRLELMLEDCKTLGLNLPVIDITLGSWYMWNEAIPEAEKVFSATKKKNADDPRIWRGLGSCHSYMKNRTTEACEDFSKALEITREIEKGNPQYARFSKKHIALKREIYQNRGNCIIEDRASRGLPPDKQALDDLLQARSLDDAAGAFDPLLAVSICHYFCLAADDASFLANSNLALAKYPTDGKLNLQRAQFHYGCREYQLALPYAQMAYDWYVNKSEEIVVAGELCFIYYMLKSGYNVSSIAKKYVGISGRDDNENFYLGLIFYLAGDYVAAGIYLSQVKIKVLSYPEFLHNLSAGGKRYFA
jgi:tetratricopeptide (TPR) repeat protein